MKTTLMIKDLDTAKVLDRKAMSAVRGGNGNQANATQQANLGKLFAPVAVGNNTDIFGGPVNFQVNSNPTQTLSNSSTSTNEKGIDWLAGFVI